MSAALMDVRLSKLDDRVLPFPLSGQIGNIRRCALELENIHGEEAIRYWKMECRALSDRLQSLGCGEEAIRQQVMAFQTEVQLEMMRRYSNRLAAEGRDGCHLAP